MQGARAYRCGRCEPCLLNRARTWTHRIQMEANLRKDNAFIGLTYSDSNLPRVVTSTGSELYDLRPKHLQDWLKRLRDRIKPLQIRFYAVGEYGDETWRPHYHAILFGFPTCLRGRTRRRPGSNRPIWASCCVQCRLVGDTWGHGDVDLGTVDIGSARYMAGYVTKKMTHRHDSRLEGREPEFSRQSNQNGGIGAGFMPFVAKTLLDHPDFASADVPSALRVGAKSQPLGRYLRKRLRRELGRDEKAPEEEIKRYELEMLPLQIRARNDPQNPSLKHHVLEEYRQKVLSIKAKTKLYKTRRHL